MRDTPPNSMLVTAVIVVRYLGDQASNMSIHHVRLRLIGRDDPSNVMGGPWTIEGKIMKPHRLEFRFYPIMPAEIEEARSTNAEWTFLFGDHLDTEYESEIFSASKVKVA